MSKLPNAPLLEVIFEIKWDITNKSDIAKFQYLHGDLYSNLKDKYFYRESLLPPEVPFEIVKGMPVYRFRKEKTGYPLVQIGPGVLTYNTIDELYFWDKFQSEINDVTKSFSAVFPEINQTNLLLTLTYIDFFEIDFAKENVIDFINKNLNLNINQSVIENDSNNDINLSLSFLIDGNTLTLNLRKGQISNQKEGIILQTKLIGNKKTYTIEEQMVWLSDAHKKCSRVFKKTTKKQLYNSFK